MLIGFAHSTSAMEVFVAQYKYKILWSLSQTRFTLTHSEQIIMQWGDIYILLYKQM